jgi:SMI1-KNR4 cell-wall
MDFQQGTALAPPPDERIRWFEATYRVKLPADYITALKKGNGAIPSRKEFQQGKRERMIERMLCLLPNAQSDQVNGWYDLTVVLTQLDARLIDDENLIGMNVIPIAILFAGDFVCLDYRGTPESPAVAVWDHEQSRDLHPVLEPVAPSFTVFERVLT